jgi:branched-chain amino acid aminotransferase
LEFKSVQFPIFKLTLKVAAFKAPDDSIHVFRLRKHAARMSNSASFLSMPNIGVELFIRCIQIAVSGNKDIVPDHDLENAFLYIRPILFGSGKHLGLTAPGEFTFVVFVEPMNTYHGQEPLAALVVDEFDRAATRGIGAVKAGGNYAPVFKWSMEASNEGFGITLHLDSKTQTYIDEFSSCGFIGVYEDDSGSVILVTPDSVSVMPSVTVDSCRSIARQRGWKFERRPVSTLFPMLMIQLCSRSHCFALFLLAYRGIIQIPYKELSSFSEVLAVGTAASIVPIKSVTRKSTSESFYFKSNKIGTDLLNSIRGIQKGNLVDEFKWCEKI